METTTDAGGVTRMIYTSPSKEHSISTVQGRNVTRIIQGHLMPIRDFNKGGQKSHYLEDQQIINKDFGVPQVDLHGQQQCKSLG